MVKPKIITGILPREILEKMQRYSVFCRKVWLACAAVPRGETITYGEIARRIGHPRAARAVGSALAKNPFAPVIPCHRVVRSDGSMGGYSGRGGTGKKQRLIEKERACGTGR